MVSPCDLFVFQIGVRLSPVPVLPNECPDVLSSTVEEMIAAVGIGTSVTMELLAVFLICYKCYEMLFPSAWPLNFPIPVIIIIIGLFNLCKVADT